MAEAGGKILLGGQAKTRLMRETRGLREPDMNEKRETPRRNRCCSKRWINLVPKPTCLIVYLNTSASMSGVDRESVEICERKEDGSTRWKEKGLVWERGNFIEAA